MRLKFTTNIALILAVLCLGAVVFLSTELKIQTIIEADGQVVPEGYVRVMGASADGQVLEVAVSEGQSVEEGQPLMVVDTTPHDIKNKEQVIRQQAMTAKVARLAAELEGKDEIETWPEGILPSIVEAEKQTLKERVARFKKQQNVYASELNTVQIQRAEAEQVLESVRDEFALMAQIVGAMEEDFYNGLVKQDHLHGKKQELFALKTRVAMREALVEDLSGQVEERAAKLKSFNKSYQADLTEELSDAKAELAGLDETAAAIKNLSGQLHLKAPFPAIVKKIRTGQLSFAKAGDPLIELVPVNEDPIVEARVPFNAIRGIEEDMIVRVKFPAFPEQNYLPMKGKIVGISPDRLTEDGKADYYKLRIILKNDAYKKFNKDGSLAKDSEGNLIADRIIPGLEAKTYIRKGKETIFGFLTSGVSM